jgi:hypothetical protein
MCTLAGYFVLLTLALEPTEEVTKLEKATADLGPEASVASVVMVEETVGNILADPADFVATPGGPAALETARLALAERYLIDGDDRRMKAIVDDLIRTAAGEPIELEGRSPELVEFHAERTAVLEAGGLATIALDCRVPCEVMIDERTSSEREELFVGPHRVRVYDEAGELEPLRELIELSEPGQVLELTYGEEPEPSNAHAKDRSRPRLGALGVIGAATATAGVGAIVAGAITSSRGPFGPPLAELWSPRNPGAALVGVGVLGVGVGLSALVLDLVIPLRFRPSKQLSVHFEGSPTSAGVLVRGKF